MLNEQQTKELQTRLQIYRLTSRINKGDTAAIIDELLALLEYFKQLPSKPIPGVDYEIPKDGITPKKGEDYFTDSEIEEITSAIQQQVQQQIREPKDGKDYVLTEKDKEQIAKQIKVPIVEKVVEKTEVIKEQPIVTQHIREMAFYEEADKIVKKLKNFKKSWIELSQIEGFDDYMRSFGENFLQQAKSFIPRALQSLYDVQITNEPTEGQTLTWNTAKKKWVPGTAVGSNAGLTLLTATGTVDGTNADFTFTSKPTYIVSDGAWYVENTGWTWSSPTATMSVPPQSVIWGFV
jgi:FtsZ-interacting cell division protein YlmF